MVTRIKVKDAAKEEQDMLWKFRSSIDSVLRSKEFSNLDDSLLLTVVSSYLVEIVARMLVIRGYEYEDAEKSLSDLFDSLKSNFAEDFKQLYANYNIKNIQTLGNC